MTILQLPFGGWDKRSALYQVIRHFCIQILPKSDRSGNQIKFMSNQFIFLRVSNKRCFSSFRNLFSMELHLLYLLSNWNVLSVTSWRKTLFHNRRRLIYLYVSVGNVSNMPYKREEIQIKNKIRLVKYLNTGRDKSKTTLDLRGDFHLYLFSLFLSSLSFFFENQIPFPSNVSFLTWL